MEANTNKDEFNFNEILKHYQIPEIYYFEDYLSEIFIDLAKKSQRKLAIEKYIFSRYFEIYGIILDRLFKIIGHTDDGLLNKDEFILGMKILYSQSTSFKSITQFIYNLYDFDQDGKISKDDVKLILSHVFLSRSDKEFGEIQNINQHQTKVKTIIDYSFQEKKEMDFNDFSYVIKNICSDIFIFVFIFLLEKRPFSDETLFVYMSEKNISPYLLELSPKHSKLDSKIIMSPIFNIKSIINLRHKKNLIFEKLLLRTYKKLFDLDIIDDKIKENILFHEGLIFKFSKDKNNEIIKVKKLFYRLIGKDLYYYKKSDLINHKGINNLSCAFVKEGEDVIIKDVRYFSIVINYYKKEKSYYFDTEKNRNIWLEKFRRVIGQKDIKENYEISKKTLGKGSSCSVIYGTNIKTKQNVSIKIINKTNLYYKKLELVMNELYILKICQHPHIIKLYDFFENSTNIYIVTEYCKNGTLHHFFNNNKLQENLVKEIIYKLLLSIKFIHSLGIIHRDIKHDNILFFNNLKINIGLIDFGLSKILGPNEKIKDVCGTIGFTAPEILKNHPYSKSVDLWSAGVVTYYLLCGRLPYNGNREEIIRETIEDPIPFIDSIWKYISSEAKDFVKRLLEKNPEKRSNIEQILEHSWVKNLKKTKEITE